jgi:hypothetical protein
MIRTSNSRQSSLRAQAKQSIAPRKERMDCFGAHAPRNDGDTPPHSRDAICVRVVNESCAPKKRAQGMPGAQLAPAASCKKTRVVATGTPGSTRHSLRNGLNGFLRALLGDRALLPPSPAECSANLMPASGRQDHTTSPYASASFVQHAFTRLMPPASIASRAQRS